MFYFLLVTVMFLIAVYVIYGIQIETKGQVVNKNDERWKAIVAQADKTALNTFYVLAIIMSFITISGDVLKRFDVIRVVLSKENLFELYETYTLFSLCIVFAIRTCSLKYYNKKK